VTGARLKACEQERERRVRTLRFLPSRRPFHSPQPFSYLLVLPPARPATAGVRRSGVLARDNGKLGAAAGRRPDVEGHVAMAARRGIILCVGACECAPVPAAGALRSQRRARARARLYLKNNKGRILMRESWRSRACSPSLQSGVVRARRAPFTPHPRSPVHLGAQCRPSARASAPRPPLPPATTRTTISRSPPHRETQFPASHSAPSPTCSSPAPGTTRSGAGMCSHRARRCPKPRPRMTSPSCARRGARTGAPCFQVKKREGSFDARGGGGV